MNELKVFSNSEFGELGVMLIDGKEFSPLHNVQYFLDIKNRKRLSERSAKG